MRLPWPDLQYTAAPTGELVSATLARLSEATNRRLGFVFLFGVFLLAAAPGIASGMGMCWFPPCDDDGGGDPAPIESKVVAQIGRFQSPSRIALSEAGNLYVADTAAGIVAAYDSTGVRIATLSEPAEPLGLAVWETVGDSSTTTYVWVGDEGDGSVRIYENGQPIGYLGNGSGEFGKPNAIAATADRVYVVDSNAHRVTVYDHYGSNVGAFGSQGSGNDQFLFPTDIAINESSSEVYVTDFGNQRIAVFDLDGNWLHHIQSPLNDAGHPFINQPAGLGICSSGHLYIVDAGLAAVVVTDGTGTLIESFGYQNSSYWTGELDVPVDAASDGMRVYVTSSREGKVNVFELATAITCGDGEKASTEECDDGNTANGDCCASTCEFETTGSVCNDTDACTAPDTCDGAGVCTGGAAVDCDDGDPCTDDLCFAGTGCINANNTPPCDYSSGCATVDTCAANAPLGDFIAYKASLAEGGDDFGRFGPVVLGDVFRTASYNVVAPRAVALPAGTNGVAADDPRTHLADLAIIRASSTPLFDRKRDVEVIGQCTDLLVTIKSPISLMVPTGMDMGDPAIAPDPNGHNVDHFLCYRVRAQRRQADGTKVAKRRRVQVVVEDQLQNRRYDLKRIRRLCMPTSVQGDPEAPATMLSGDNAGQTKSIAAVTVGNPDDSLACFKAETARRSIPQSRCGCDAAADPRCRGERLDPEQGRQSSVTGINLNNQFGPTVVDTDGSLELCVPMQVELP